MSDSSVKTSESSISSSEVDSSESDSEIVVVEENPKKKSNKTPPKKQEDEQKEDEKRDETEDDEPKKVPKLINVYIVIIITIIVGVLCLGAGVMIGYCITQYTHYLRDKTQVSLLSVNSTCSHTVLHEIFSIHNPSPFDLFLEASSIKNPLWKCHVDDEILEEHHLKGWFRCYLSSETSKQAHEVCANYLVQKIYEDYLISLQIEDVICYISDDKK